MHSACVCGKFVLRYLKLLPYKVYRYLLSWSVLATGFLSCLYPVDNTKGNYWHSYMHMKHVEGSLILLRGIYISGEKFHKDSTAAR